MQIMKLQNNKKQGFVILYAVIVASVVSLSGILLGNIIVKQIILSSIGRESQFAYYGANVIDECIKNAISNRQLGYYDINPFTDDVFFVEGDDAGLLCEADIGEAEDLLGDEGKKIEITVPCDDRDYVQSTVIIKPSYNPSEGELRQDRFVTSVGYNICDENHPRRIEKVIYRDYGDPSS